MKRFAPLLILFLFSAPVRAQENVVLPDLAPRIVEITGDLTISFPSLDRQPLIGFNPPPRVPEIPGSRRPFTDAYKQSKDELPPSPLQEPEAPKMSPLSNRTAASGMAEIGAGRYLERYVRGHFSTPLNAKTDLFLSAQHAATDGHEPFSSNPDINTYSKSEFINAGVTRAGDRFHIGARAGMIRNSYSLFGAVPVAVSPSLADPGRKVSGVDGSAWIASAPGAAVSGRLSVLAEYTTVETSLYDPFIESDPTVKRAEDHLLVEGAVGIPFQDKTLSFDGHLSFQGLDTDGFPGRTVPSGSAAGRLKLATRNNLTIDAGMRLLGFDALGQASGGADRSLLYLSPDFLVEFRLSPASSVTVSNQPEVSRESTRDVYFLSPYIEDRPAFQPVLTPIHFNTSIHVSSENFVAAAGVGWKSIKNYRYIESALVPVSGFGQGFLTVNYEEASIVYMDARVGATLSPGLQANIDVAFRKGNLGDSDTVIPYFSPVTSTATLVASLLSDRLKVKLLMRGESSRFSDREETLEVPSLLLFDVETTYYVTTSAGIVLGIRDLGKRAEYWENYESESSVFYAGARWRW